MSFADAVRTCLSKYVGFSGRARRSEYWWFVLFTFLVNLVASIIDAVLGTSTTGSISGHITDPDGGDGYGCVSAYLPDGSRVAGAETDADSGAYRVNDLEPGSYFVSFESCDAAIRP